MNQRDPAGTAASASHGWAPRIEDLWRWTGTLDRGRYAVLGLGLALLKYNVDRIAVGVLTGHALAPWDYWAPGWVVAAEPLASRSISLYVLLVASLPFVWVGVAASARRLRSCGLPVALVLAFFVPLVNVLFFLVLALLPPRSDERELGARAGMLARIVPKGRYGSAACALLVSSTLTLAFAVLGVAGLRDYGWGVFVGMPFFLGFSAALIHGYHEPRTLGECLLVAGTSILLLALLLLALAIEGLICIAMAAPIGLVLAGLGAVLGWSIQSRRSRSDDAVGAHLSLIVALPALLGVEHLVAREPRLFEVATEVEVDAPPERVWTEVVGFAELPAPDAWYFERGIAYPIRADIEGSGVGAIRRCVFSTGAFVEPIEVWDEPHRLAFSVREQPPALHEWSPWAAVVPAHVSDYLVSERGEFRLERRADGGTHLVGTTWYTHRIFPEAYWRIASDWILHRIHERVLLHVRLRAEAAHRTSNGSHVQGVPTRLPTGR